MYSWLELHSSRSITAIGSMHARATPSQSAARRRWRTCVELSSRLLGASSMTTHRDDGGSSSIGQPERITTAWISRAGSDPRSRGRNLSRKWNSSTAFQVCAPLRLICFLTTSDATRRNGTTCSDGSEAQ